MAVSTFMELANYALTGTFYAFTLTIFIIKKKRILSNFIMIETEFIRMTKTRGMNQNHAYENVLRRVKQLYVPFVAIISCILLGPLVSMIFNSEVSPIDDHSNFILPWPKVSVARPIIMHITAR